MAEGVGWMVVLAGRPWWAEVELDEDGVTKVPGQNIEGFQ
jgi:hypothetical protein